MKLEYTAGERDGGRKVYNILKSELRVSAEGIKRLKAAGAVTVDGVPVFMDRRMEPGQTLEADLSLTERPPDFPPERGETDIVFENEAYLALNKPAGMLTHPSRGRFTGTLANFAAGYMLDESGSPVIHAVNRLDRDTSGVVLFAKSAHAKALAVWALRQPDSEKMYHAYLGGELPGESGVIDLPIDREREGFQRRVVREGGKNAVTEYETLARAVIGGSTVTYVRLRPRTGRTHQIRVHCSHLGAPVLGDALYASDESRGINAALGLTAHLLHASSLTFTDPAANRSLTVAAPVKRPDMLEMRKFFENSY